MAGNKKYLNHQFLSNILKLKINLKLKFNGMMKKLHKKLNYFPKNSSFKHQKNQ